MISNTTIEVVAPLRVSRPSINFSPVLRKNFTVRRYRPQKMLSLPGREFYMKII
jgi:hypothetical protein